jgi:hypothetical protein
MICLSFGYAADLFDDEAKRLINYARRKYAQERYPFSPAFRSIREALTKLDPKPEPGNPARTEALRAECAGAAEEAALSCG